MAGRPQRRKAQSTYLAVLRLGDEDDAIERYVETDVTRMMSHAQTFGANPASLPLVERAVRLAMDPRVPLPDVMVRGSLLIRAARAVQMACAGADVGPKGRTINQDTAEETAAAAAEEERLKAALASVESARVMTDDTGRV